MLRYQNYWLWRSDISSFFDNIDHTVLQYLLPKKCQNTAVAFLIQEIIASYNNRSRRGIPIGNLTSQIFANIYLNEFDQFVLHSIKPLGYVRYGDDFVLFCQDESNAQEAKIVGTQFLNDYLRLEINPRHDSVQKVRERLDYLGVSLWPSGRRLQPRTQKRMDRNLDIQNLSSYQSLVGQHMPCRYINRLTQNKLDILDQLYLK